MKFLHIADLHLGKQLNDVSMIEDQRHVLNQMLHAAHEHAVDAVLISGDVYQKASPPLEAMALFDDFITRLRMMGKEVFVISGNHDSAQRISHFAGLLEHAGVHVSDTFDGHLQSFRRQDVHGVINIHLLPFVKPGMVRRCLPGVKISTYQDAVAAVLDQSHLNPGERHVLLCHQFITGSETCDSEEMAVGGLDNIDASVFDAFDYVALGHIHKAQQMTRPTLRYAGSPLKYSFSEAAHKKSMTIVDMQEKGSVSITKVALTPLHDLRLVSGMLDELLLAPYTEDYVWVTIHDELPPPDARITLSTVFPNMLRFSVSNSKTKLDMDVTAQTNIETRSVPELFCDFYRLQNNDQQPGEAHMQVLEAILKELEDERREAT